MTNVSDRSERSFDICPLEEEANDCTDEGGNASVGDR